MGAMDQKLSVEIAHLAEADRHIAEAKERIAQQERRARSPGAETESAQILRTMQETLAAFEEHRALILSRIADLKSSS